MHWYQFIIVFLWIEGFGLGSLLIASGKRTWWRVALSVLCLFVMLGGFMLGDYWMGRPADYYVCHPNQHCFPWGD